MYQQIPPPPYQPSSYQPPCPPYSYQQPYPPYGDPSGAQPPHRGGLRAWAVVLIALGTFFLGIFTGVFLSAFSMAASEISIIAGANMTIHITTARPIPMG